MNTGVLLEYLQKEVDCMYLSDLRLPENFSLVQRAAFRINPEDYSLKEWNDAVEYITGQTASFEDVKQAVLFMQNYRQKE